MGNEARRVLFHLQLTGPPVYPPLDSLGLVFYASFFVAVTLLTMRRPAYGACALIAAVPFAFYQQALGETITLSKAAVLALLLGLSAYRDAFAPLAAKAPWRVLSAGVFVVCAMLLSFVHAAHTQPVLREALKIVEYLLAFCAAAAAYRLDPDRRMFATALLVTAIAVSVLALAQEIVGSPSSLLVNGHPLPRIAGPLEGPNQLAGYFDIAIPVALVLAVRERMALASVALFFTIFADALTFSRGGLLGALAAMVTVAIVLRAQMRAAVVPVLLGLLASVSAMLWLGAIAGSFELLRWWNYQSSYAGGVGTRSQLWHAAIQLWKQHPIFGIGAGNFELEIPLTGLHGVRTHANSLYLQALVEGGIPLFAATLWLVLVSILTFAREHLESPFVLAALAAGVALALHQVVDFLTFFPKVGAQWWIVMALAAAEMAVPARIREACA